MESTKEDSPGTSVLGKRKRDGRRRREATLNPEDARPAGELRNRTKYAQPPEPTSPASKEVGNVQPPTKDTIADSSPIESFAGSKNKTINISQIKHYGEFFAALYSCFRSTGTPLPTQEEWAEMLKLFELLMLRRAFYRCGLGHLFKITAGQPEWKEEVHSRGERTFFQQVGSDNVLPYNIQRTANEFILLSGERTFCVHKGDELTTFTRIEMLRHKYLMPRLWVDIHNRIVGAFEASGGDTDGIIRIGPNDYIERTREEVLDILIDDETRTRYRESAANGLEIDLSKITDSRKIYSEIAMMIIKARQRGALPSKQEWEQVRKLFHLVVTYRAFKIVGPAQQFAVRQVKEEYQSGVLRRVKEAFLSRFIPSREVSDNTEHLSFDFAVIEPGVTFLIPVKIDAQEKNFSLFPTEERIVPSALLEVHNSAVKKLMETCKDKDKDTNRGAPLKPSDYRTMTTAELHQFALKLISERFDRY